MEFVERKRLLFFGLPWTFTKYTVTEEVVNIKAGLLKTIEDDCYLYKVTDVKLETSLIERMFILEQSEAQRLKRRTLNTQSLNAVMVDEIDEVND